MKTINSYINKTLSIIYYKYYKTKHNFLQNISINIDKVLSSRAYEIYEEDAIRIGILIEMGFIRAIEVFIDIASKDKVDLFFTLYDIQYIVEQAIEKYLESASDIKIENRYKDIRMKDDCRLDYRDLSIIFDNIFLPKTNVFVIDKTMYSKISMSKMSKGYANSMRSREFIKDIVSIALEGAESRCYIMHYLLFLMFGVIKSINIIPDKKEPIVSSKAIEEALLEANDKTYLQVLTEKFVRYAEGNPKYITEP